LLARDLDVGTKEVKNTFLEYFGDEKKEKERRRRRRKKK